MTGSLIIYFIYDLTHDIARHIGPAGNQSTSAAVGRKMADLTQPAAIHWVDGSQEEYDQLCAQMVRSGTLFA